MKIPLKTIDSKLKQEKCYNDCTGVVDNVQLSDPISQREEDNQGKVASMVEDPRLKESVRHVQCEKNKIIMASRGINDWAIYCRDCDSHALGTLSQIATVLSEAYDRVTDILVSSD